MYRYSIGCLLLALFQLACSPKLRRSEPENPLSILMQSEALRPFAEQKEKLEIQIILTQIDRDQEQHPHFTTWYWQVDSTRYFYPASTVKFPVALLALEKRAELSRLYPALDSYTPYRLDSVRPYQQPYFQTPQGKPCLMRDVEAVFAISDNDAYNHLFDFVGREDLNRRLRAKGYQRTGLMHRFYQAQRDQRYAQPIVFYQPTQGIYKEGEKIDTTTWRNPQKGLQKGSAYMADGQRIEAPFDFSSKNWFALTDLEQMLRAVLFPEAMPAPLRFKLHPDDLKAVHRAMGRYPREFVGMRYDTATYYDHFVKFLAFADDTTRQNGRLRSFNKVGYAYGTLTDAAYIVDLDTKTEFILAATILCNSDGVFNDDQYDFETVGFPFLSALGRAVLGYERERPRKVKPELGYWERLME